MDSIYENSELTIIAAAGADESYGLPGVRTRSRTFQPTARIGDVKVVWTMRDPHYSIRSSKWFTRGWTFQEAVMSNRRLFFTEEQVYFECKAMNCFESIHTPLKMIHIEDKSKIRDSIRAGIFGRDKWDIYGHFDAENLPILQSLAQYWTAVEEYSARDLSYDKDSLNAFQGIIQQFSKRRIPTLSIWGISYPECEQLNLQNMHLVESLTWSHIRSCWADSNMPRRRNEFPSWSWAGWAGKVEYRERPHWKGSWFFSSLQFIAVEDRFGNIITLDSPFRSIFKHENSSPRILYIKAAMISPNLFSYDKEKYPKEPWAICGFRGTLVLSRGSDSETCFYEELKTGCRWQCIVMGNLSWALFVMVLETHIDTEVTSRAGLFIFREPCIDIKHVTAGAEWRTYRIV